MIKKWCFLLFLLCSFGANAQRFGYLDSEKILDKMPEYKTAKAELDKQAQIWQTEIETMQKKVIQSRTNLEAEKVLFTEDMLRQKQADVEKEEAKMRDIQNRYFGYEGLIFRKRQELMKPIQDKIFAASQKIARKRNLSFIFDKASDFVMIYADPTHDYTELVVQELGLEKTPVKNPKDKEQKDQKNKPKE